jgi:hypothetical protein
MAERSIGMTTGSGDGDVGGYSSSRMTTFFSKIFGDGLLQYGESFAISGTGTSSVVIGTGAAMVKGFFYEQDTYNLTLSTTGLANDSYYLVIASNNTASPRTVSRCEGTGATTTTLAAYTVRVALVTSALLNTNTDITIAVLNISSGLFSSITTIANRVYAEPAALGSESSQVYNLSAASVASSTTAYTTLVTGATYSNTASQSIMRAYTSGGVPIIALNALGTYHVETWVKWDTNTTGARIITVDPTGSSFSGQLVAPVTAISIVNPGDSNNCYQYASFVYTVTSLSAVDGKYLQLRVAQNSGTARAVANASMRVTRF